MEWYPGSALGSSRVGSCSVPWPSRRAPPAVRSPQCRFDPILPLARARRAQLETFTVLAWAQPALQALKGGGRSGSGFPVGGGCPSALMRGQATPPHHPRSPRCWTGLDGPSRPCPLGRRSTRVGAVCPCANRGYPVLWYPSAGLAKAIMAFRDGDRSEYIAQSAFSTIGFVATVCRQEDRFLTDLLVQLNVENDGAPDVVEPTGLCVAVQVKSNHQPISDTHDPSTAALIAAFGQLPWFVAVVEKKSGAISVYSTIQRHFWRNASTFSIALEAPPGANEAPRPKTVYIGPPIVRVNTRDLDSADAAKRGMVRRRFRQAMMSWARLDTTNIAYRSLGIPAIVLPRESWRSGVLSDEDTQIHFITGQVDPELVTRSVALASQSARICLQRVGLDQTSARTRTILLREMRELNALLSPLPVLPRLLSCALPLDHRKADVRV